MANIVGPAILEKLRNTSYKNSVFAMAEIIDNSVDWEAKNVEIITLSINNEIKDIFFVDNGVGMNEETLQKSVIFSESNNTSNTGKTGKFGMGLPNSSLSQCKKFAVLSRQKNDEWAEIEVNFQLMLDENSLEIQDVVQSDQERINLVLQKTEMTNPRTIIHWANLDRLDNHRPSTVFERISRLIGKTHRHMLMNGVSLTLKNFDNQNTEPNLTKIILPNDPLFLYSGKQWIASDVIKEAEKPDNNEIEELSTNKYFKKFIIDQRTKSINSLFYEPEGVSEEIKIYYHDKELILQIKVSVAYPEVQKPGIRQGGNTKVGTQIGIKMNGTAGFPGGNISWVRNNREITSGNYNLFNTTKETQRWWSVEVMWDNDSNQSDLIDQLLQLSHDKHNINYTASEDMPSNTDENAGLNRKREELMVKLTSAFNRIIKKSTKILTDQANDFKKKEKALTGDEEDGDGSFRSNNETNRTLLEVLGKGAGLDIEGQNELTLKIHNYLGKSIPKANVEKAVKQFSAVGLQNIIIYSELDERDLYDNDTYQGIQMTLINTKHEFYKKVIAPIKDSTDNNLIASIELLISSLSRVEKNFFQSEELANIIKRFRTKMGEDLKDLLEVRNTLSLEKLREED